METKEISEEEVRRRLEDEFKEAGQLLEKFCEAWEKEHGSLNQAEQSETPSVDAIHHPDHYNWKGAECIDVIEIMTEGLNGIEAYYMGNIIKYLYRYPKKGTLIQDLRKAAQYVEFLLEHFEEMEENDD